MLCQVNDKLCTMVRDHWARYLMLKHIALASTMEKLVLFLWSFLIHGGSFKGLLHPRRDSFGKKVYLYVLQKIKITYIICRKFLKINFVLQKCCRHNFRRLSFNSRWPSMWCLQIFTAKAGIWERKNGSELGYMFSFMSFSILWVIQAFFSIKLFVRYPWFNKNQQLIVFLLFK